MYKKLSLLILLSVFLVSCAKTGQIKETEEIDMANVVSVLGDVDVYVTTNFENMFVKKESLTTGAKGDGIFVDINVDISQKFQEIDGFGASFTDSSSYLINQKLDTDLKNDLMSKLFSPTDGIGLSFTRTPMGSSDFSRDYYSFDDIPEGETDENLEKFSIDRDREDTIPLLKQALELNPDLKIMASPWSPPAWLKTSGSMVGGSLKSEYFNVYAQYFVKYIQEYKKENIDIFAITPQNEPLYVPTNYSGNGMDAAQQAAFIKNALAPAFREAGIDTKILCYDHNWDVLSYPQTVLSVAGDDVDGVAWHWYGGDASAQSKVHDNFPDKDVYFTEGSGGEWIPPFEAAFMTFAIQSIEMLNNWSKSVVFWNFALDENNGPVVPQFSENDKSTCRGIVLINQETGELTYNLDYYALAHFSKFIRPQAVRVFAENKGKVYVTAALNKDNTLAIVAANDDDGSKPVRFNVGGNYFKTEIKGKSVATFVLQIKP